MASGPFLCVDRIGLKNLGNLLLNWKFLEKFPDLNRVRSKTVSLKNTFSTYHRTIRFGQDKETVEFVEMLEDLQFKRSIHRFYRRTR